MLKSMTAYGRHEAVDESGTFVWEMRSVNHRYLDLTVRLPEEFRSIETQVRDYLKSALSRGKVEVSLRYKPGVQTDGQITVNETLAAQLAAAAGRVKDIVGESQPVSTMEVLRWPGVVSQAVADSGPLQRRALAALKLMTADYLQTRGREGEKTAVMLAERCDAIEQIIGHVRQLRPRIIERQRSKLFARIEEFATEHDFEPDSGRLEQELVYIAQKLDVEEELDRLTAHVSELRDILKRDEPVGRRLDFLVQEFNREANTLSSKSADTDTTAQAVELKVLIEQMREQIQNVE